MKTETIGLVGLDRVGASVGLRLKQAELGLQVIGHDPGRETMRLAREMGAIDIDERDLRRLARMADILIINLALSERLEAFRLIGDDLSEHAVIVDFGRLKMPGIELAGRHFRRGHYLGARPVLSATHLQDGRSGLEAARADLFRNSVFCITTPADTQPEAVETAVNLGSILGATPFFVDAAEYDNLLQGIETAPGLISAALFMTVSTSPGWRDLSRFAGMTFFQGTASMGNPDLAQLATQNREVTLHWIGALIEQLRQVQKWVADGDEERLELILANLEKDRQRWLGEREKNDWSEVEGMPDVGSLSVAGQLFGFRRIPKEKKG